MYEPNRPRNEPTGQLEQLREDVGKRCHRDSIRGCTLCPMQDSIVPTTTGDLRPCRGEWPAAIVPRDMVGVVLMSGGATKSL